MQTDSFDMLKEAVESDCDEVRFGSEFCEWKIPRLNILKKAYELVRGKGKNFVYVTPLSSNDKLDEVRKHLTFLNREGKISVVVNSLGMLNVLGQHRNLTPHLGRRLIFIPARCPWPQFTAKNVGFFERRSIEKIFFQTGLNYESTIRFYQKYGVEGVDVDWIPKCFPYYGFLVEKGLKTSVHTYLVPATLTRRCHMARFLGEKNPERCSKPCSSRAFLLRQNTLGIELFLWGNGVFRFTKPSQRDARKLEKTKVSEFVVTMNPITKIDSREKINAFLVGNF